MLEGITPHPAALAPMSAVATILAQFDRSKLEAAIEVMIGLLDLAEPDIDLEDSETGSSRVDVSGRYLGDWISDPQDEDLEPDDDAKGDTSYTEWHTRGRHKLDAFGSEPGRDRVNGDTVHEDAEEDDAGEDTDDVEEDDHPPVTAYTMANEV